MSISNTTIIIFAKTPQAGKVKTRLIPALGAEKAAELAVEFIDSMVFKALVALEHEPSLRLQLCISPDSKDPFWQRYSYHSRFCLTQQIAGDLGARMAQATQKAMATGGRVLLIGSDCPALSSEKLMAAVKALQQSDAVMHPAFDGGYVLLGLSQYSPAIFSEIPWSTPQVAALTLKALNEQKMSVSQLETLHDIDEPADLTYL